MNNNNENKDNKSAGMGFIDDYANDNIKNKSTIRKRDGNTVYSNPLENEDKPRRRVTKHSRKRYRREMRAYTIIAVFLCIVTLVSAVFIIINYNKEPKDELSVILTQSTDAAETLSAESDTQAPAETEEEITASISVPSEDIYKGNLILVNYKYKYVFPDEDILVSMYDQNSTYSVNAIETYLQEEALESFSALTDDFYENSGCDNILVVSSFRTVEKQEAIYQDRVDRYGSEYAAAYVANPGYSEHHTGLAMDLQIYTNGTSYDFEDYELSEWFLNNYDKYGYVLRYPENKADITTISYEGWHYRYVGLPHSLIMDKLDLCLEEYIDYLRDYTADAPLVYNKNTGELTQASSSDDLNAQNLYTIYYVPADEGEETTVPLLTDNDYTISGNNVDGFIVTFSPAQS